MVEPQHHAKLIVHDLDAMSAENRNTLVQWLIAKANELSVAKPGTYAKTFTARLMKT